MQDIVLWDAAGGWGASWEDARRPAYEMMQQVAPGKMLAIAEDSALLSPDIAPVRARYIRLYCSNPAVTWQAYTLFEFGVYEGIPEYD